MAHRSTAWLIGALVCLGAPLLGVSGVLAHDGGGGLDDAPPSQTTSRYDPTKEYQAGLDALKASDFKTADSHFDHVLEVAPKNASVLILSGIAKDGLKDFKAGRDAYKKALDADSTQLLAQRGYALDLVATGDATGAGKMLDTLKARAQSCGSCADAADIAAAVSAVQSALGAPAKQSALTPPHLLGATAGDSAYVAAISLVNDHRYGEALQSLAKAEIALGPHPDILTYIGFTYRKMGQYDTAERYYRQALSIAPNHIGATEYYGELKVERGDIKGAKVMLAKLDTICSFGCYEAEELRRWVTQGHG